MGSQAEDSRSRDVPRERGAEQSTGRKGTEPKEPSSIFDGTPLSVLLTAEYRRLAALLADRQKSGLSVAINILPGASSANGALEGLLLLYANDPVHRCKHLAIDDQTFVALGPVVAQMLDQTPWAKQWLRLSVDALREGGELEPLAAAMFDSADRARWQEQLKTTENLATFDLLRMQSLPEVKPDFGTSILHLRHAQAVAELALVAARQRLLQTTVAAGAPEFHAHFSSITSGSDYLAAEASWLQWYAANTVPIEVKVAVPGTMLGSMSLYVYKPVEGLRNAGYESDNDLEEKLHHFLLSQGTYFGSTLRLLQSLRAKYFLELAFERESFASLEDTENLVRAATHCLIGCRPTDSDTPEIMELALGGRLFKIPVQLKKTQRSESVVLGDFHSVVEWQIDMITPPKIRRRKPLIDRLRDWLKADPEQFCSVVSGSITRTDVGGAYPLALLIISALYIRLSRLNRDNLMDEVPVGEERDDVLIVETRPPKLFKRSFQLTVKDITDRLTHAFSFKFDGTAVGGRVPVSYVLKPHSDLPSELKDLIGEKRLLGKTIILVRLFGPKKMPSQVLGNAIVGPQMNQNSKPDLIKMLNEVGLAVNCDYQGRTIVTQTY